MKPVVAQYFSGQGWLEREAVFVEPHATGSVPSATPVPAAEFSGVERRFCG